MTKAVELAKALEKVKMDEGMDIIEKWVEKALSSVVIDDVMCIMHSDGSVNFIDHRGYGIMAVEVISPENILKVLKHYRPFKEVFNNRTN